MLPFKCVKVVELNIRDVPLYRLCSFLDALASLDFKLSVSGSPFFTASASTDLSDFFLDYDSMCSETDSTQEKGILLDDHFL